MNFNRHSETTDINIVQKTSSEPTFPYGQMQLTLWEAAYDIFVLQFRPKKQQFMVDLPTP